MSDDLTTTEVLGLAEAFGRPGIAVSLELQRLNGDVLTGDLTLPDEASAVTLKALVWRRRGAAKDAVDLWRMLEVANAAGVSPVEFDQGVTADAAEIARGSFERVGDGAMQAITSAEGLSDEGAQRLQTRIQALLGRALG